MTPSRKRHQHDYRPIDDCHKNLEIHAAAVYQINRNIQHSNKQKLSYSDDAIMQKTST